MTRSQFFKHFDLLADQPDAVAKMRELVLGLAVRGKLVSNGSKADKNSIWTKFLADTASSSTELEPAFDVPGHWCWARLDDVAAPCGQKKPDTRFTYVDVGAIDNERGVIKESVEVLAPEDAPSRARKLVVQNSVIYSTVRPYLKNIAIIDRKFSPSAIVSTAFAVLNPKAVLNSRYLYYWLRSRSFQTDVESKMKGVAYPAISDSEFWQCPIPVPPPGEQRRIVAKVDELMALCDELEQRQQARQHARAHLTQSAYHHLTTAPDPAAFRKRLDFILHHSSFILDDLPQLRQAILQLAVQGRLVPQDAKEGTASSILDAKLQLPKGYSRPPKRAKDTPIVLPDNLFAALPGSWSYASVQELYDRNAILDFADGNHGELYPRKNEFGEEGVRFVTAAQIDHGRIQWEKVPRLNQKKADELTKGWSRGGDVLLTHNASVGDVAFVEPDAGTFLLGTSVTFYRLHPDGLDSRFIFYVFQSPLWQNQLAAVMAQTTRNQVSIQKQAFFKIPIPPLAEQKRIVARVEALLRQCDALEAHLRQTRTLGAHLLDSTLHHLLAA